MNYQVGDRIAWNHSTDWARITRAESGRYWYEFLTGPEGGPNGSRMDYDADGLEDVTHLISKKSGGNMSLVEGFTRLFLKEPERTYRELGITNGDGIITEEGAKLLLSHLLQKGGTASEFYKEVATPMLEDTKKAEKK